MDWFIDSSRAGDVSRLLSDIMAFLHRHADADGDFAGARLAVTELLANLAQHAPGRAWVELDWSAPAPRLVLRDLGPGLTRESFDLPADPLTLGGRGLFMVDSASDDLSVVARESGGTIATAILRLTRAPAPTAPPARMYDSLPSSAEAESDGTFGKQAFLRALAVELAQVLELTHGPAAAAQAIEVVGTGIGARMEQQFRQVRGVVGRLSMEQISELLIGLKRAIDGDFYLIELTDERIVLGNRACPFGDAVLRAPHLCKMTSSVFTGIAARNSERPVDVRLAARIAVGDPECRVVLSFGGDASAGADPAHVTGQ